MNNYNSNSNIESNININNNNNKNNSSNNNGYLNNPSDQDLHSLHHKNANSTDIPRDNDADVEDRSQHEEEEDDDEVLELDDDHSPRGHNLIHSHQQFQQQQSQQQRQYQHQQHLQQMQQQTHTSPNNNSIHHTTNHQHLDHSENIILRKSSFDYNDYNQTNLTTQPQLSTSLSNSKTSSNLLNNSNLLNTSRNQSLKQYNTSNSNEDNNHNIGVQNETQRNIQFTNHVHPYTTNSHHTLNSQQQQQQQKHHVNSENSGSVVSHQHTLQSNSISLPSHSQNQLAMNLNNAQPDNFPTLYSSSTHSPGNQIRDTQLTHSSTPDSSHTTPHDHHQNHQQQQQQRQQKQQTEIQNKVTKAKRTNKPGAKFGAKKKSWVWNWFFQDHMDTNKATCKKCNKLIIRLPNDKSSPKKLIEHLKTHKITRSTIEHTPTSNNVRSVNEDTSPFQIDSITEVSGNDTDIKDSPNQTMKDEAVNIYDKPVRLKRSSDDSGTNVDNKKSRTSSVENNKDRDSYSSLNFQRDVIDFLKENKLPIKTIKSKSFRKLILNLKPSAVKELDDLDNFYSSFIEIFNYSKENVSSSKENGDSNDGKKGGDDDDDDIEEEDEESDGSTIGYHDKIDGNIYKSADDEEELNYNK
ncbi:hypothetical protein BVG19_g4847 [[Candida] boidinii]|nr:hypothetical protein BVG19_g4847 [[Candida] boidinii]OWB54025.1 hypothetical protein B5S27_g5647 [[Candida] boidinii]